MTEEVYYRATGKRKCAVAQVKLMPGTGTITVNGRPFDETFTRLEHRRTIEQPLVITNTRSRFDIQVKVTGGGISGQAEAIRHGISRALLAINEEFKPILRKSGLLTRDPRVKERKKYGLKRARKAPQYTKR
ncbi:MAG: 30S ribosomal protein S9 [Dehalococcoidia bacterium]|nr:30S ribosomal protein S9 [Dehalococcoidia bacterium]